jgi:hypothetical protein
MIHEVYGSTQLDATGLAAQLAVALDVEFVEHDSYYRGRYLSAEVGDGATVEVQPNAVPGDDGEESYDPSLARYPTLILVRTSRPEDIRQRLCDVPGVTYVGPGR